MIPFFSPFHSIEKVRCFFTALILSCNVGGSNFSPVCKKCFISLKKISDNQEIDRERYERNNPVSGDDPIYDWSEATIDAGYMVHFVYAIPEGQVFFLEYLNAVHNLETTYYIWIDGVRRLQIDSVTILDSRLRRNDNPSIEQSQSTN